MIKGIITAMITSMLFFPDPHFYERPEDYGYAYEDVWLTTEDQVRIHGWYLKAADSKAVLLYAHGNAGNISGRLSKVKGWVERGISVFLFDYRSYGKSEGSIQYGNDIVQDAEAAFRWLKEEKQFPASKIILYGESLGTYPIIRLGSKYDVVSVILEAPYTSFADLAPVHYGMLPPFIAQALLRNFKFPNIEHIDELKAPVFILHGMRDETCPFEMGEKLFEKATEPKGFFSIPNGMHNDLPTTAGEDYWNKPHEFVMRYLG